MSIQALDWVFGHSTARGSARLVLLAIANHAGWNPRTNAWESYPGIEAIGDEAGIGRRQTIKDALSHLVETGQIERIVNGAPDRRIRADQRPNLYILPLVPPMGEASDTASNGGTETVPPREERGLGFRANGGSVSARTGARKPSPKPSFEPSVNQPPLPPRSHGDGSPPAGGPAGGREVEASRGRGTHADRERRARIFAACRVIAVRTVNAHRPGVSNPDAYLDGVAGNLVAKYTARASEALDADPGLVPEALAALLEPTARDGTPLDPAARPRPADVTGMPTVRWDPPPETAKNRIVGAARAALTGQETP